MPDAPLVVVRNLGADDRPFVRDILERSWGDVRVVSSGTVHDASALPGHIAEIDGRPAGLATYRIDGDECEVVTLDAVVRRSGVGSVLLRAVADTARGHGCNRLWLVTTNDNLAALRFYVRNGMRLVAVHRNALDRSRQLKPSIPVTGRDGIPLQDEWELELRLAST